MELKGEATLLRIFIGESDKARHGPLYEAIVREARSAGLAGATVWQGLLSYGPTSHVRTAKILDLSADLPLIIEIVDTEDKIQAFLPKLSELFDTAQCGGLVTMEPVRVIKYFHGHHDGTAPTPAE